MPTLATNGVSYASSMAQFTDATDDATWPAGVLNEAQGCVAFRYRPAYDQTGSIGLNPKLMDWRNGAQLVIVQYNDATDRFNFFYSNQNYAFDSLAFSAGDDLTIIVQWDGSSEMSASVNGATLQTKAIAVTASMSTATAFLGNRSTTHSESATGSFHWVAAGTGYINSTDAAAIGAFGNTDPVWENFPANFGINFLWPCDSDTYQDAPNVVPPAVVALPSYRMLRGVGL